MSRAVLEPLAFFVAPFAAYAIFLVIRARYPLEVEHWTSAKVSILTLVGLAAAVLSLLVINLLSPRGQGVYVPAHEENGALVPGHFE
jgi:hypothetical protein